jgi:hypothetical protein
MGGVQSKWPTIGPKNQQTHLLYKVEWVFIIFNTKMIIKHKISNGNVILFPKWGVLINSLFVGGFVMSHNYKCWGHNSHEGEVQVFLCTVTT